MKIAYRSGDEVNRNTLESLTMAHGDEFRALEPWATPQRGQFDLLIYDFDYMPGPECDAVVQALLAARPPCKVVVHGYNVDDLRTRELEASGVIVLKQLVPNSIRKKGKL
jgi:hypothetical protein